MIHRHRRFNVAKIASAEELVAKISSCTWTLCTGFDLQGYLFLNDSFSEDSAQEYAVIKDSRQVENITFSWCSVEKATQAILDILRGRTIDTGPVSPRLDHPDGTCSLCR